MNEWKNIIVDGMNKGVDVVQNILLSRYERLCKWYTEYDNKKGLTGAVALWLFTFSMIIFVCRISNAKDVAVSANETVREEVESSLETSDKEKVILKDTSVKQQDTTATTSTKETESTIVTEEMTVIQEKETIDISKIEVSSTPIADDRERVNEFATISSIDVKTVSSSTFDRTQFSYGIDISYHQGKIDWAKVKASGVDFAIIRVGNRGYETGKLCKDSRFDENVRGALANGIKVGVYFFSQATTETEALEEASLTLDWIKGYDITLPVVIDWETDVGYRTYSGLSKARLTNILTVFCDTVSRYGYEPMVYMCKDDFVNRINTKTIASNYKTWVAWYFKEYRNSDYSKNLFRYGDLLPDMSFDYNIWQYSDRGQVDGIREAVDMNVMILPKKVYEVKLENKNSTFVTNIGKSINLMEGVTASDSSGNSATSSVQVNLYNSDGKQITEKNAFAKSGTYKIQYYFLDGNGTEVRKESTLYVRNVPEMYFDNIIWNKDDVKTIEYSYDENMSVDENYKSIIGMLESKCCSYYYDMVVGVSDKHVIKDIVLQGVENIIVNEVIDDKAVDITYIAKDKAGLESTRRCKLVIHREETVEETSEDVSVDEETKDNTVAQEETT